MVESGATHAAGRAFAVVAVSVAVAVLAVAAEVSSVQFQGWWLIDRGEGHGSGWVDKTNSN